MLSQYQIEYNVHTIISDNISNNNTLYNEINEFTKILS